MPKLNIQIALPTIDVIEDLMEISGGYTPELQTYYQRVNDLVSAELDREMNHRFEPIGQEIEQYKRGLNGRRPLEYEITRYIADCLRRMRPIFIEIVEELHEIPPDNHTLIDMALESGIEIHNEREYDDVIDIGRHFHHRLTDIGRLNINEHIV